MSKKRDFLIIVAVCLTCMSLCLLIWPVQPGCPYLRLVGRNRCESNRDFSADQLLIEPSWFGTNIIVIHMDQLVNRGAIERNIIEIQDKQGNRIALHEIERWATSIQAEESYDNKGNTSGLPAPPCGIPPNPMYESSIADSFCGACTIGNHCKSVARYKEYVSIFEMTLSPNYSEEDFKSILAQIELQFEKYLKYNK
jgi:hypothetical protein